MDLGVSPDLDAFYCYAVVFALGVLTALNQISTRLGSFKGRWIMVNTWLLFFAYSFVPVVLFWALDRTNALHDTSLFAAILVGVGYQQILSGGLASIQPAGDISKIWQPFAAWADSIADRIRDRIQVNDSRFDAKLLQVVRADPTKFERLRDVALTRATDLAALQQSLAAVDNQQPALPADVATARKSAILYSNLKASSPQTFDLLLFGIRSHPVSSTCGMPRSFAARPRLLWWRCCSQPCWYGDSAGSTRRRILATIMFGDCKETTPRTSIAFVPSASCCNACGRLQLPTPGSRL